MFRNLNKAKPTADEIKTIEKLPQVLAIQKKKLLTAINKTSNGTVWNISQEEEHLVKEVTESLDKQIHLSVIRQSTQWKDSQASLYVQSALKKHANFELHQYLDYASVVCQVFLRKQEDCHSSYTGVAMEFVLTHARQFGNPTKTIFPTTASVNPSVKDKLLNVVHLNLPQSSQNSIVRRATQLINELSEGYDETKFQALNTQITSFMLLLLRRVMKKSMHHLVRFDTYKPCIYLVIEAYLTCEDEKTKKNIHDTCVKYMEWYDMQLPGMFFKIVDLYGIEVDELWDILSNIKSRKINKFMIDLAEDYYNQYNLSKDNSLQSQHFRWFRFSRLFGMEYHRKLSNAANVCMCVILSNLIERKNVLVEPAYSYLCPDKVNVLVEWAKPIATELFSKINKT